MNRTELIDKFVKEISESFKIDTYNNDEYLILNVYVQSDVRFSQSVSKEYDILKIEYHYAHFIITETQTYVVGLSDYNPNVEYITLRIKK